MPGNNSAGSSAAVGINLFFEVVQDGSTGFVVNTVGFNDAPPLTDFTLPVEFQRFIRTGTKVLIVEDLVSSRTTVRLLSQLVEDLGGQVIGIGALWRRTKKAEIGGKEIFSLVSRDFPTYAAETCPLCKKGVALNQEYVKRREHRKPSSAHEKS